MDYTEISQTAAIILTIMAFGTTQYFNRKSTNADSFVQISAEYSKVVTYRLEHPEVLETGAKWQKGDLGKIGTDRDITRYYSYGELCISFCTICLHHRKSNSISKADSDSYYSGLMDSVASENRVFFEDMVNERGCAEEFKRWFLQWKKRANAWTKRPNGDVIWSLSLGRRHADSYMKYEATGSENRSQRPAPSDVGVSRCGAGNSEGRLV